MPVSVARKLSLMTPAQEREDCCLNGTSSTSSRDARGRRLADAQRKENRRHADVERQRQDRALDGLRAKGVPPVPRLPMKMRAVLAVSGTWKLRMVLLTSLPMKRNAHDLVVAGDLCDELGALGVVVIRSADRKRHPLGREVLRVGAQPAQVTVLERQLHVAGGGVGARPTKLMPLCVEPTGRLACRSNEPLCRRLPLRSALLDAGDPGGRVPVAAFVLRVVEDRLQDCAHRSRHLVARIIGEVVAVDLVAVLIDHGIAVRSVCATTVAQPPGVAVAGECVAIQ